MHPYTQALLAAVLPPRPVEHDAPPPLAGEVPSARRPPPGCAFHPRCPYAQPICSIEEPRCAPLTPQRSVACHFAGALVRTATRRAYPPRRTNMYPIDLTNQRAIVTGSSTGIGRGIAVVLATAGADVAVHYTKNAAEAEKTGEPRP
jgi:oligopeptide/dipeptide ABC transporter ATP-binding protein